MQADDISNNDLMVVSDAKDPNTDSTYVSKKLQIGTLKNTLLKGSEFNIKTIEDLRNTLSSIILAFGGTTK